MGDYLVNPALVQAAGYKTSRFEKDLESDAG